MRGNEPRGVKPKVGDRFTRPSWQRSASDGWCQWWGSRAGYTHNWQVEMCKIRTHRGQKIGLLAWIKRCPTVEGHTIYFNDGDWRLVQSWGTEQPQVNPEPGGVRSSVKTAGQARLSPPRGGRPMWYTVSDDGHTCTKVGGQWNENREQCCRCGVGRGGKSGQMRRARA